MKNLQNVDLEAVIDRLKKAYDVKSEAALAREMSSAKNMAASWRQRGQIPYQACVVAHFEKGVPLEWLFYGVESSDAVRNPDNVADAMNETLVAAIQMGLVKPDPDLGGKVVESMTNYMMNQLGLERRFEKQDDKQTG